MAFCYTHRSGPCSEIIRDASFWSRWEQIETHWQTFCRDVFIKSLPWGLKKPCGRRGKKCKSQQEWQTRPSKSSEQSPWNSQRLQLYAQGLHKCTPDSLRVHYDFWFSVFEISGCADRWVPCASLCLLLGFSSACLSCPNPM